MLSVQLILADQETVLMLMVLALLANHTQEFHQMEEAVFRQLALEVLLLNSMVSAELVSKVK